MCCQNTKKNFQFDHTIKLSREIHKQQIQPKSCEENNEAASIARKLSGVLQIQYHSPSTCYRRIQYQLYNIVVYQLEQYDSSNGRNDCD